MKIKPKNFALIGAAGYIAPRHMRAIRDTGNKLVAAFDPSDSVGVIDSYHPDADFFTEFERFDRHIEKLRHDNKLGLDYVTICSPNYLHDAHVRFALRVGANAICEKPLVLNPWNLDALETIEKESGRRIYTILQLRLHPAIKALRDQVKAAKGGKRHQVDLTYITSRGNWYLYSWKGDQAKSGGLATNIGIHFFDMLSWVFGPVRGLEVHSSTPHKTSGILELEKAHVKWFLSIDRDDLPAPPAAGQSATFRSVKVDGKEVEFSEGFTDLHTESYKQILAGKGFGLKDCRQSVQIVHDIRHYTPTGINKKNHPLAAKLLSKES
jgi:UDP-N-acetyl-2-amino-2-deoxyglucuronate dehydrogenase